MWACKRKHACVYVCVLEDLQFVFFFPHEKWISRTWKYNLTSCKRSLTLVCWVLGLICFYVRRTVHGKCGKQELSRQSRLTHRLPGWGLGARFGRSLTSLSSFYHHDHTSDGWLHHPPPLNVGWACRHESTSNVTSEDHFVRTFDISMSQNNRVGRLVYQLPRWSAQLLSVRALYLILITSSSWYSYPVLYCCVTTHYNSGRIIYIWHSTTFIRHPWCVYEVWLVCHKKTNTDLFPSLLHKHHNMPSLFCGSLEMKIKTTWLKYQT